MREGTTSLDEREVASTGVGILDGTRREDNTVTNLAVACYLSTIAKHAVIAHHGIVADVGSFEQEVVITNLGNTILVGTAVDNHVLADDIVIAYLNIRLGTTEVKILWQGSNHRALMDFVVITNARAVADANEGEDDTVVTNHHIVLDIHKGEYLTVVANLGLWANLGFWTYFTCHNYSLFVNRYSLLIGSATEGLIEAYYSLHF